MCAGLWEIDLHYLESCVVNDCKLWKSVDMRFVHDSQDLQSLLLFVDKISCPSSQSVTVSWPWLELELFLRFFFFTHEDNTVSIGVPHYLPGLGILFTRLVSLLRV